MRTRLSLPRIYPITDLGIAGVPCHGLLVASLGRAGATLVQLREKHMTARAFYLSALRAVETASRFACRVIINDDLGVCLACGAHGVHVGDEDIPPEAVRKALGPDAILGVSSHSVDEALRLSEGPCDYVALGPIYPTSTKPSHRKVLGPESIRRLRSRTRKPVVAIGGITEANLREVFEAGADSAAMIASIMAGGDPGERFSRLNRTVSAEEREE